MTVKKNASLPIRTAIRFGAISVNHNASAVPVVRTAIRSGAINLNHNERCVSSGR
ncbi:hypothetical protein [Bryobacter aggregatus]|uniref:hypothetical protein n=1 Tax=Bryobacter aggregatus TaxID=360054 RepID=UPI0012BA6441|nr:hypothetical protein [Bryobacter aggregatus]